MLAARPGSMLASYVHPPHCSCRPDAPTGHPTWDALPDDDDEIRELVERSCAEQGLPVKVTDPATVRRVATLLLGRAPG
jgi:hypothetical protein